MGAKYAGEQNLKKCKEPLFNVISGATNALEAIIHALAPAESNPELKEKNDHDAVRFVRYGAYSNKNTQKHFWVYLRTAGALQELKNQVCVKLLPLYWWK